MPRYCRTSENSWLQRDLVAAAEADAVAEEIGQQDAHPAGAGLIAADERCDRMQAVEQEVRVDLGAQRRELRVARQDVELEAPRLGLSGRLVADEQVVREAPIARTAASR